MQVAAGWDRVEYDLAKLPRKSGSHQAPMTLRLSRDGQLLARVEVSARFELAPEHALPEVRRGSTVMLAISRGSVEVTAPALVNRDASFGDVVQVTVRGTNKAVQARLEPNGRATLVGEP
jgi:hypothetical protein